jgi:hypothetical protein
VITTVLPTIPNIGHVNTIDDSSSTDYDPVDTTTSEPNSIVRTPPKKVINALKKLTSFYNPDANKIIGTHSEEGSEEGNNDNSDDNNSNNDA